LSNLLNEAEILKKHIPKEYHDFADVFLEGQARLLPPHRPYDHKIELISDENPPFGKVYTMSKTELKLLKDYIDNMLVK
jgi:hypothetical protein